MEKIKQICDELQATNGKIEKENILLREKDNEPFKKVIYFLLNPFIVTGLSDKKINKLSVETSSWEHEASTEELLNLLNYIKENNTGKDENIIMCHSWMNSLNSELQEFVKSLLTKSLKLGISEKTVNKIYGKDFIPEWEVQQAYSIDKYTLKPNEWFSLSHKLNGNRASYLNGKLISRQGQELKGFQHIIDEIELLKLQDMFIDGELVRKNIDDISDNENFRIGTGIINSDAEIKEEIEFVIFDFFPNCEFSNGESKEKYNKRMAKILKLKESIMDSEIEHLNVVNFYYCGTDKSMIDTYLDKMVAEDKEGLILNRDTVYKCKRHNGILKVKRFYTMDLKVIDIEEGSGRLKGTLGALVVDFKGNRVNVGSGFDDATRTEIWNNQNNIINKIIEVKYKEISKDKKTGLESLQFPIYIQTRFDKDNISYD